MDDVRRQGRRAGLLYLLLAVCAPLGLLYVPGQVIVSGDATATADNLRNLGGLVRAGMASELVHQVVGLFLVLALYRLFKPVDVGLARQMAVFGGIVSVPIVFVNVLNHVAALTLVSGADYLAVFERAELDALAYLFVRLHGQGLIIAAIFWGLWLLPFGTLIIRSKFIPKALGILLWIAGIAYLADSFATLILPAFAPQVSKIAQPLLIAELPIIFYLLIWGARPRVGDRPAVREEP